MLLEIITKQNKKLMEKWKSCKKKHITVKTDFCEKCGTVIRIEHNDGFAKMLFFDHFSDNDKKLCGICNFKRFIVRDYEEYAITYFDRFVKFSLRTTADKYLLYAVIDLHYCKIFYYKDKEKIDLHVIEYSSFFQGV